MVNRSINGVLQCVICRLNTLRRYNLTPPQSSLYELPVGLIKIAVLDANERRPGSPPTGVATRVGLQGCAGIAQERLLSAKET